MNHDHKEAFALMTYRCEQCGETEKIWNSRDGVTPFIVRCRVCGNSMVHIDWHKDEYKPNHVLKNGDRYFFTPTKEEYKKEVTKVWKENREFIGAVRKAFIKSMLNEYDRTSGQPSIGIFKEGISNE